jgi:hypothetical protein|nr:MAG TPA: hypothetical protein [Caudoviricetes sp.]
MSISIINSPPGHRRELSEVVLSEIRSNANYVEDNGPKKYDDVIRHVHSCIRDALRYLQDGSYDRDTFKETVLSYVRTCSLDPLSNGIAVFILKQMDSGRDPLKIFGMDKSTPMPKRIKDAVLLSRPLPTNTVEEELDEII